MKTWKVLAKEKIEKKEAPKQIEKILFKNRKIIGKKKREEFLNPKDPGKITLKELGLNSLNVKKATKRIETALKKKEKVIVYGDYDADGICATAILWETLFNLGINALPYIPDRFSEGYGLNKESIALLQKKHPDLSLIITVDNAIVATEAVDFANKNNLDVIITDHHTKAKKTPKAYSIIHTTDIGGAGIAYFFAREIRKNLKSKKKPLFDPLDLACLGTIADQIPLLGANRSLVKFGIAFLQKTRRPGLTHLYKEASLNPTAIGIYHVGYLIAPRINAMGRLGSGLESLRLLCTLDEKRAQKLAYLLGKTNTERQETLEKSLVAAKKKLDKEKLENVLVVSHKSFHEGVVGLVASRLVEEYYRPAIVISEGREISKASARSILGFSIIEAIRSTENLLMGVGGHPMAAGFSIRTEKIIPFAKKINTYAKKIMTEDLFERKLTIDVELGFDFINQKLINLLKKFEPAGIGNPRPTFLTKDVEVVSQKTVGKEGAHLKLTLSSKGHIFEAIAFNKGSLSENLEKFKKIDIVFSIDENVWNGRKNISLQIKDIR